MQAMADPRRAPHMVVVGDLAGRRRASNQRSRRATAAGAGTTLAVRVAPSPPLRPRARPPPAHCDGCAPPVLSSPQPAAPPRPQRESSAEFRAPPQTTTSEPHIFAESHWCPPRRRSIISSRRSSDTIRWCRLLRPKKSSSTTSASASPAAASASTLIGRIGRLLTDVVKEDHSLASQFKQKARQSVAPGTMPAAGAQNQHTFFCVAVFIAGRGRRRR